MKYRMLKELELIKGCDEVKAFGMGPWEKVLKDAIGEPYLKDRFYPMRRPLPPKPSKQSHKTKG